MLLLAAMIAWSEKWLHDTIKRDASAALEKQSARYTLQVLTSHS